MEHPKSVGDRSTLASILALQGAGYIVALPFGENARYDLLVDDGARLSRVQCKTGRIFNGAIRFPTSSTYAHHRSRLPPTRNYIGEIDHFAVFCPEASAVYLVPIEDVRTSRSACLRLEPAKNGQRSRIRMAEAYRIARVH